MTPISRMWNYLNHITSDYSYGKTIRVFHLTSFIMDKCRNNRKEYKEKYDQLQNVNFKFTFITNFLAILQEGAIYIFLVYQILQKKISFGDFSMCLSAAVTFTHAINNLIGYTIGLNYTSLYVNDYIHFINLKDSMTKEGKKSLKSLSEQNKLVITFENVSFQYPETEHYVLNNINVELHGKEKITLVGDNGAGKSTFIKLLLRLYDPTAGKILLNGTDIKDYDYHEYLQLFSVVFQDYQTFAFTIAENVAFQYADSAIYKAKIEEALDKVDILNKIKQLPDQTDTFLGKGLEEKGIELSGGEMQKIAIARSIFKDGSVAVLDEPTANISPIAEYNIYKSYHDFTNDKLVVYVSHRLSSSMFSDKIVVLNNGCIEEIGTHKTLMEKQGLYAEMFRMQSQYYLT